MGAKYMLSAARHHCLMCVVSPETGKKLLLGCEISTAVSVQVQTIHCGSVYIFEKLLFRGTDEINRHTTTYSSMEECSVGF